MRIMNNLLPTFFQLLKLSLKGKMMKRKDYCSDQMKSEPCVKKERERRGGKGRGRYIAGR